MPASLVKFENYFKFPTIPFRVLVSSKTQRASDKIIRKAKGSEASEINKVFLKTCYGAFHRNDRDLERRRRGLLVLELLLTN